MTGIAEMTPVMRRPMKMPAIFEVAATGRQKTLYSSADAIYSVLRPNLSEYGNNSRAPNA